MRYIRYAFLAALAIVLVSVALANRGMVMLQLLPSGLADLAGMNRSIELPLFIVIFGGIVAGLLIGFVWEWRELRRTKAERDKDKDEVLALLDNAS